MLPSGDGTSCNDISAGQSRFPPLGQWESRFVVGATFIRREMVREGHPGRLLTE